LYVSRRMSGNLAPALDEPLEVEDETEGVAGPRTPAGGRLGHWLVNPVDPPAFHALEPGAPRPRVKESYLGSYRVRGSGAGPSPLVGALSPLPAPPLPVAPRDARRERPSLPMPRLLAPPSGPKPPPGLPGGIGTPTPPLILPVGSEKEFRKNGASKRRR
jgi:hypothetical protein